MIRLIRNFLILILLVIHVTGKLPIIIRNVEDTIMPLADEDTYRLPNNTRPDMYNVSVQTWVDEQNFTFVGNVKIVLTILSETSVITLHHRELTIDHIILTDIDGTSVNIGDWYYEEIPEFLNVPVNDDLIIDNQYILEIFYTGTLRLQVGFYRQYYTNVAGDQVFMASSKFEPTDARHAFPCFDEPSLKAIFNIQITHSPTLTAISNMPVLTEISNVDDTVTTIFEQTPPISTYLVAYHISDFPNLDNYADEPIIPHRVFAKPTAIDQTELALDAGIKILDAFIDYLQVNYSLPKMDQVGIPDFTSGAMENWGLVTYHENSFFYNPTEHTYTRKTSVISTIAHEFAHQWFGDLVSPKWWTYLWLNEGFATIFASYATDLVYTDWNMMDNFLTNTVQGIFISDASATTRQMTYYVESPTQIRAVFDNINYNKAGSVIRMFMNAFSPNTFQKGLNYYLNNKAYGAAVEEDLFDNLEIAVKEDQTLPDEYNVGTIFSSWTQQSGFPLISVTRNYVDGSITIGQERYLTYPTGTISSTTFWIPINFATANNADFSQTKADYWLPQGTRLSTIQQLDNLSWNNNEWVIVNKQATGYYRVQYDRRNWNMIIDELVNGDFEKIHRLSRSQLIDDSFTFGQRNRINWEIPFNIIEYLQYEYEYAPWASFNRHFTTLNRYLPGLTNYQLMREFIAELTEYVFNVIGVNDIEDEPHLRKYLRTIIVNVACAMGSDTCMETSNSRLQELIENNLEIHQNIKGVLYCAGLRNGNQMDFDYFWDRMFSRPEEQSQILTALGCISDQTILREYLENSLNTEYSQTIRTGIFNGVYQNSQEGLLMATQFLNQHFSEVSVIFNSNNAIGNALTGISQRAINSQVVDAVYDLLNNAEENNAALSSYIRTANTNIFTNLQWLTTHGNIIDNWILTNRNNRNKKHKFCKMS